MNKIKLLIPIVLIVSLIVAMMLEFSDSRRTDTINPIQPINVDSIESIETTSETNTSEIAVDASITDEVIEVTIVDEGTSLDSDIKETETETETETEETEIEETVIEEAEIESTDIQIHSFSNAKEITEIWKQIENCCNNNNEAKQSKRKLFYEACSRTLEITQDDDVSAHCLWHMPSAVKTMKQKMKLHEQYINKHLNYNMLTDYCRDCSAGDMTTRVTMQLADEYRRFNRSNDSVTVLERVSDNRRSDISPWLFAELTIHLSLYYQETKVTDEAAQRVSENVEALLAHRNNKQFTDKIAGKSRNERLDEALKNLLIFQKSN